MERDNKPTYIMQQNEDISSFLASIYSIVDKANKNTTLDKAKSSSLLQRYLQNKEAHEEEGDKWTVAIIEKNRLANPNQILRYSSEPYVEIIKFIDLHLSKNIKAFAKSEENGYTEQIHFSVSRTLTDVTPQCNYLGLIYRMLNKESKQILKFKFSPYFNAHTQKWEICTSYQPRSPEHTMAISVFNKCASNLSSFFSCSLFSTMTPKYLKVINFFYPQGLDKNRPFYAKDIQMLNECVTEMNKKYDCNLVINENGIIVSRNKQFKLSKITERIPPMSSYVFHY
jgi:hypothetical protein